MKHPVSPREQVLELRRTHTLSQVAKMTGLPLGTVKTWCARSGAFKDNPRHRALFTLPAIRTSQTTALSVPELPPQTEVTGDKEVDAVLWLREVIKTGQETLIEKAMEAAKRMKTPLKDLEKRYLDHLTARNPSNWMVVFQTLGFADLQGLAKGSTTRATTQHEALSRFGSTESLFANTPAEQFTIGALQGLKPDPKNHHSLNESKVDTRFNACAEQLPHTLSDCLVELAFWHDLYRLRNAVDRAAGDSLPEAYARERFAVRSLGRIRPQTKQEAVAVFRYLADSDRMDDSDTEGILLNLIG